MRRTGNCTEGSNPSFSAKTFFIAMTRLLAQVPGTIHRMPSYKHTQIGYPNRHADRACFLCVDLYDSPGRSAFTRFRYKCTRYCHNGARSGYSRIICNTHRIHRQKVSSSQIRAWSFQDKISSLRHSFGTIGKKSLVLWLGHQDMVLAQDVDIQYFWIRCGRDCYEKWKNIPYRNGYSSRIGDCSQTSNTTLVTC